MTETIEPTPAQIDQQQLARNSSKRPTRVANRPVYVVGGGARQRRTQRSRPAACDAGDEAKFGLSVLTEIQNRGVEDVGVTSATARKAQVVGLRQHLLHRAAEGSSFRTHSVSLARR